MRAKIYKSYLFRDKDPAIDELRTVMQQANGGKLTNKHIHKVEEAGGPAFGTMHEWFHGKTKRPQNATLEAAGRALGYKRVWVRHAPNK